MGQTGRRRRTSQPLLQSRGLLRSRAVPSQETWTGTDAWIARTSKLCRPIGDVPGQPVMPTATGVVDIFDVNWIGSNWTAATSGGSSTGQLRQVPLSAGAVQTPASSTVRLADDRVSSAMQNHLVAATRTSHVVPTASDRSRRTVRAVDAIFDDCDLNNFSSVNLDDVASALVSLRWTPMAGQFLALDKVLSCRASGP